MGIDSSPPCGSWDQIQIIMSGGKSLYLLLCLASPLMCVFIFREVKDQCWIVAEMFWKLIIPAHIAGLLMFEL